MKEIKFVAKGATYSIPNAWELLTPRLYLHLMKEIGRMAAGEIAPALVRAYFVCRAMRWNPAKIDTDGYANLAWLSERVDFIFNIAYPDPEALNGADAATRRLFLKTPPENVPGSALARYLATQEYTYVLDSCFCAQLLPEIKIGGEVYGGYRIDTSFDTLTCSLTALQFIEARALLGADRKMLPLLAAILYYPGVYDSEGAHTFAHKTATLPDAVLSGIAFNFQCFVNYLFSKTDFRILTCGTAEKQKSIATGALETLYNLTSDGMGDITTVERMNIIKYLTVLRKKLIESVRTLSDAKLSPSDIAGRTGLPIHIINNILQ